MSENCKCCVCGLKFTEDETKHIEIKGKVKNICEECLASITGLV